MNRPEADPFEALDRLLALRPEDLDGWENSSAASLSPSEREAEEDADSLLDEVLAHWSEEPLDAPHWDASSVIAMAEVQSSARGTEEGASPSEDVTRGLSPLRWRRRASLHRRPPKPVWATSAGLAASLALLCFAAWQVKDPTVLAPPATEAEGIRLKAAAPTSSEAQLALQISVEEGRAGSVQVQPASEGQRISPTAHVAFRSVLGGRSAFLHLAEVQPDGHLLILEGGLEADERAPGAYSPTGEAGGTLVYRPDRIANGTHRYLSFATAAPIEAERVARALLAAGLDRPDLWPRPVLAAADFELEWASESPAP